MSNGKKDFYSLADLTRAFEGCPIGQTVGKERDYFMIAAMLAHAQQLSVISGHLATVAACLEKITGAMDKEASDGK